jgi:hypothetical protein
VVLVVLGYCRPSAWGTLVGSFFGVGASMNGTTITIDISVGENHQTSTIKSCFDALMMEYVGILSVVKNTKM